MRALALLAVPLLALALAAAALHAPIAALDQAPRAAPEGKAAFATLVCPNLNPLERCNVRATAANGPANEVDLAMDPLDPDHLVLVAKGYNTTRQLNQAFQGGVLTPTAASFDGGLTWQHGTLQPYDALPLLPLGSTATSESDPVVDFTADGQVMASTLRVGGGQGLPIYKSADGGLTFQEVALAYAADTDKQWQVLDPSTGLVYLATANFTVGGIDVVKSATQGLSWSAPRRVCNGCLFAGLDAGPEGVVYASSRRGDEVLFHKSTDQGQTWTLPLVIGSHSGDARPPSNLRAFRTPNIGVLAADRDAPTVYVVWASQPPGTPAIPVCEPLVVVRFCPQVPNHDVWLARSADGGATWAAPVRINQDPTDAAMQFMPTVAVGPGGDVHVAWLDQRHDPSGLTATVYYAHSADGLAWDPELLVSDQPFLTALAHHQSPSQLAFVGDYIALQASEDRVVVAFPDTRYGRSDAFVATIR